MKKLLTFLLMLVVGIGTSWGIEAGKYYTIKAYFSSYPNLYLECSNSALAFNPRATMSENQVWVAEASGNNTYPWKFRNLSNSTLYLTGESAGVSTTAGNFNLVSCTTVTSPTVYHLQSTLTGVSGVRNVGTWSPTGASKTGFGLNGSGGCYGTDHANSTWTTDYVIEEWDKDEVKFGPEYSGDDNCGVNCVGFTVPTDTWVENISIKLGSSSGSGVLSSPYLVIANASSLSSNSYIGISTNNNTISSYSSQYIDFKFNNLKLSAGTYYMFFSSSNTDYTTIYKNRGAMRIRLQSVTYSPGMYWSGSNHTDYAPIFTVTGFNWDGRATDATTFSNKAGEVGYPSATSTVATELSTVLKTISRDNFDAIPTKLTAFKSNSADVVMPTDKKGYTLTMVNYAGVEYPMVVSGTSLTPTSGGTASTFYVHKFTNKNGVDRYAFISSEGNVIGYRELTSGYTYDRIVNDFQIGAMTSCTMDGSIVTSEAVDRCGYVYITEDIRKVGATNSGSAYTYIINNDGTYNNTIQPQHNSNYTSAITMTEDEDFSASDAQLLVAAKIDALCGVTGKTFGTGDGEYCYYSDGTLKTSFDDYKTDVNAATTVAAVNALYNSVTTNLKDAQDKAIAAVSGKTFGKGIGKYHYTAADETQYTGFDTQISSATSVADVTTLLNSVAINQPEAGFYRFYNSTNDQYVTNNKYGASGSNENNLQVSFTGTGNETIFYWDGTKLQGYSNGALVDWTCNQSTGTTYSEFTIEEASVVGNYAIKATDRINGSSYCYWSTKSGQAFLGAANAKTDANTAFALSEVEMDVYTFTVTVPEGKSVTPSVTAGKGLILSDGKLYVVSGNTITKDDISADIDGYVAYITVNSDKTITITYATTPSTGAFYRFKCNKGSKYLSSDLISATRGSVTGNILKMVDDCTTDDNVYSTIFYLDANKHLRAYKGGYQIKGKTMGAGTFLTDDVNGSTELTFTIAQVSDQTYYTIISDSRYIYGASSDNAVNGGTSPESDGGSYWIVEQVTGYDAYPVEIDNAEVTISPADASYTGASTIKAGGVYAPATGSATPVESDFTYTLPYGITKEFSVTDHTINIACTDITVANKQLLFDAANNTYPFRIPAITKLANDNLLAVCDYRWNGQDVGQSSQNGGRLDIVGRLSSDNGKTWGEQFTIAQGDGSTGSPSETYAGYGDAAIVTDWETGETLLMTCFGKNGEDCWSGAQGSARFVADKNSTTFTHTTEYDLTGVAKRAYLSGGTEEKRGWFFTSGRICQSKYIKVGSNYRIYSAIFAQLTGANPTYSYVLYSDDFGKSWSVLGGNATCPIEGGNECKVEELPDGRVVLSSRTASGRDINIFTYTNAQNAEGSWGTKSNCSTVKCNATNGEILLVPAKNRTTGEKAYVALQSNPSATSGRYNVAIYYKVLSGYTDISDPTVLATEGWSLGRQISSISSAYTTMVLNKDGDIAFIWEENNQPKTVFPNTESYDIWYETITLGGITGGTYEYDDTETARLDFAKSCIKAYLNEQTEVEYASDGTTLLKHDVGRFNAKGHKYMVADIDSWTGATAPTVAQYDFVAPFNYAASKSLLLREGKFYYIRYNGMDVWYDGSAWTKAGTITNPAMKAFYYDGKNFVSVYNGYTTYEDEDTKAAERLITPEYTTEQNFCNLNLKFSDQNGNNTVYLNGNSMTTQTTVPGSFFGKFRVIEFSDDAAEEEFHMQIKIASSGYSSFYTPVTITLPAGLNAYTAKVDEVHAKITYTNVGTVIPADCAVFLKGTANTTYNLTVGGETEWSNTSDLVGTIYQMSYDKSANTIGLSTQAGYKKLNNAYVYTLSNGTFKYYTGTSLAGFKCHYELQDGRSTGNARTYTFSFDDDTTTGIINMETGEMHENGDIYNVAGQRINNLQHGVNIINGKKVIK